MAESLNDQQAAGVCDDLMALISACKMHLKQIAEESGLTTMQLFALRAISDGNNATGKIASILHCDASNVTGIVDRLISLELATRQEDSRDRRVKTVQLTTKGNQVLQDALKLLPSRLACNNLSQQELQDFHTISHKLIRS